MGVFAQGRVLSPRSADILLSYKIFHISRTYTVSYDPKNYYFYLFIQMGNSLVE